MHKIPKISALPNSPAIYALYGGKGQRKFVAYIGIADKLRQRISQHLVRRDSSIVTGTSIVSLNPDYVTALKWWEYPDFSNREYLEAAEEIAFDIFDPVLRSRGKLTESADILLKDGEFHKKMKVLFKNDPSGSLEFPDFQDLLERLTDLETEIKDLKSRQAIK
ncbi:MAG: hypothetical protein M0Q92_09535 [Methanoregula sp.]|jgi:extradiol dioxygenase family protein|nr:hypothetical protein [Methanoregula sp.]